MIRVLKGVGTVWFLFLCHALQPTQSTNHQSTTSQLTSRTNEITSLDDVNRDPTDWKRAWKKNRLRAWGKRSDEGLDWGHSVEGRAWKSKMRSWGKRGSVELEREDKEEKNRRSKRAWKHGHKLKAWGKRAASQHTIVKRENPQLESPIDDVWNIEREDDDPKVAIRAWNHGSKLKAWGKRPSDSYQRNERAWNGKLKAWGKRSSDIAPNQGYQRNERAWNGKLKAWGKRLSDIDSSESYERNERAWNGKLKAWGKRNEHLNVAPRAWNGRLKAWGKRDNYTTDVENEEN